MSKKPLEAVESEIEAIGDNLSVRLKETLASAQDWKEVAESTIKKNPALCLAGAFIVGFAIAKVARHA